MSQKITLKIILILLIPILLASCGTNIFKRADIKDTPVNVNDRVKKNIEEGRGIRFGKDGAKGGVFDFASSNELWRASIEILDFVPFTNASYSGGILITEWFDGNSENDTNINRNLKITVRFLTNEIRSDALDINIHEKICKVSETTCSVKKISSNLENEIKIAILKRAAFLEKNKFDKNAEEYRKKKTTTLDKNRR
tara:strand:+ start:219 stop:809 length:591 start_codon:yes stop_codon:yes gene_type:complete